MRLWDRLDEGADTTLTVVCGSVGAGKTILVSSWLAERVAQPVAWVTLDDHDDHRSRFWPIVLESIGAAGVPVTPADARPGEEEGLIVALADTLAAAGTPVVLVLDDLHEITDRRVLDDLVLLTRIAPAALRIVAISRSATTLPIERMLLEGRARRIDASELAFAVDEARALLDVAGVSLDDEAVHALWSRTEGWAAGLGLAVLGLRAGTDVAALVGRFGGPATNVGDYLFEEVFEALNEDDRRFLLMTSIVETVCGELADVLTGDVAGGASALEDLCRRGFPIGGLGGEHGWYRVHQLVSEFLREELRRRVCAGEVRALHRRAASWLAEHDRQLDAVRHALLAEDPELMARILTTHSFALLLEGRLSELLTVLRDVPRPWLAVSPMIGRAAALGAFIQREHRVAEQWLAIARQAPAPATVDARWRCDVARLLVEILGGAAAYAPEASAPSMETLLAMLDTAPDRLEETRALRAFAQVSHGASAAWRGEFDAGEPRLSRLPASAEEGAPVAFIGLAHHALIAMSSGRLHRARALAQRALTVAAEHGWGHQEPAVVARGALAGVALAQGELAVAGKHLAVAQERHAPVSPYGRASLRLRRAELLRRRGRPLEALHVLELADEGIDELLPEGEHRMALAGERALAVAALHGPDVGIAELQWWDATRSGYIATVRARLDVERERYRDALAGILPWLDVDPRRSATTHHLLQAYVVAAVATAGSGDRAGGLRRLEDALALAGPETFVSPFHELAGPLLRELLRDASHRGTGHPELVGLLLLHVPQEPVDDGGAPASRGRDLSERELGVLRLLPTTLTNRQIADELFVTVNTVKSHLKQIYAKLGVHGRREAVTRARQRGLLGPPPGLYGVPWEVGRSPGGPPGRERWRTGGPMAS